MNAADFFVMDPKKAMDPLGQRRFAKSPVEQHVPGAMALALVSALVFWGAIALFFKAREPIRFLREPVLETTGRITRLDSRRSGDSTTYYAAWSYEVDGRSYESGVRKVRSNFYKAATLGSGTAVVYLAASPEVSRIEHGQSSAGSVAAGLAFISVLLLCIPLIGAAMLRSAVKRYLAFRRHRKLLTGAVLAAERVSDGEGNHSLRVRYQFNTPEGLPLIGTEAGVPPGFNDKSAIPAPGTPVFVLYANPLVFEML
ncbi:MAG: hypothetical protein SF028_08610 [Candidatus Sumerlaeia bacterium]|nr:hypothetical protein [Candidatus Sumerlaeia bacterium]